MSPASGLEELTTDRRLVLCSSLVANWRTDSADRRLAPSLLQFSVMWSSCRLAGRVYLFSRSDAILWHTSWFFPSLLAILRTRGTTWKQEPSELVHWNPWSHSILYGSFSTTVLVSYFLSQSIQRWAVYNNIISNHIIDAIRWYKRLLSPSWVMRNVTFGNSLLW